MQRLEVSGAVRLIYRSLGVKGLRPSSISLCLLPRLPFTYRLLRIVPSITRFEGSFYARCHQST